jgi:hypothetical protein
MTGFGSWLSAHPGPLAIELSSSTRSIRLTDQAGAVLSVVGLEDSRTLIAALEAAGRIPWAPFAARQQLDHLAFLAALSWPRIRCATTVDRAIEPAREKPPLAGGTLTAATIARHADAPETVRRIAAGIEAEDRIWRTAAARGYRLDMRLLPVERQTRHRELDAVTRDLKLDIRQGDRVKAEWLTARGIGFTRTEDSGWTQPSVCDVSRMQAEFADEWKAYERAHSTLKRVRILDGVQRSHTAEGRLHPLIQVNSATTGRMSVSRPGIQGWPAELRQILRTEPGTDCIAFDHSSAEMRVLARLMGDASFTRKIVGSDIYQQIADLTGTTRGDEKWRLIAYTYGQRLGGLAKRVGAEQARATHEAIEQVVPEIPAWCAEQTERAARGERLVTLFGRPLPALDGCDYDHRPEKAANLIVQGSARDAFGLGVRRAAAALGEEAIWIPLHDELFVLAPHNSHNPTIAALSEAMTVDLGDGVSMTGEARVLGNRWGK